MIIRKLVLFLSLVAFSNSVMAEDTDISAMDNAIYIQNFEAGIGKQAVISIKMKNANQIRGYQCDLYLPNGITFALDDSNNPIAKISGGRTTTEYHSLTKSIQSDGALRLLCNASEEHYFSDNDGEVAQVTVNVSENMVAGDYSISLKNIKMGASSNPAEGTNIDEIISTVTVEIQNYDVLLDENSTSNPTSFTKDQVVRVKRTIKANVWSTICLPFQMNANRTKAAFGDDCQLAVFKDYTKDGDAIVVNFDSKTFIKANTPHIIKVSNDMSYFETDMAAAYSAGSAETSYEIEDDETGDVETLGKFTGTYVANTIVPENNLFLNSGKFWYSTGQTQMKAYRAYFYFKDATASSNSSPSLIQLYVTDENGSTTRIDKTDIMDSENLCVYSLSGMFLGNYNSLDKLPKGIYIVNGKKKVIMK
jgi:hypothetical protein